MLDLVGTVKRKPEKVSYEVEWHCIVFPDLVMPHLHLFDKLGQSSSAPRRSQLMEFQATSSYVHFSGRTAFFKYTRRPTLLLCFQSCLSFNLI